MQKLFMEILNKVEAGLGGGRVEKETAEKLMMAHNLLPVADAKYLAAFFVNSAIAQIAHRPSKQLAISPEVEAVQIEWISNGILVRGKGADGAFCNYYRDTSAFVNQHLNGKTFDFVKGKEPKTGDKCVVYFGIADTDTE